MTPEQAFQQALVCANSYTDKSIGGAGGISGATFTPSVSGGVISWTNDKGLANPPPADIRGERGERGEPGEHGQPGLPGKDAAINGLPAIEIAAGEGLSGTMQGGTYTIALKGGGGFQMPNNAYAHNAVYRGKYHGDHVSDEHYAMIAAGTFDDLFIGDYWAIGGVNYRIAAFDYLSCKESMSTPRHHAVIVPDEPLYNRRMSAGTTAGGYVGSEIYASGLAPAIATIKSAFPGHVLMHIVALVNAVDEGTPTGFVRVDREVDLMNEQMVFGGSVHMPMTNKTVLPANCRIEKSQLPLFRYRLDLLGSIRFWLRDTANAYKYCNVSYGEAAVYWANDDTCGILPYFCIHGGETA